MAEKAAAAVVDFSNVKDRSESGISKKRVPEGDYLARVIRVEDRPVKDTKEAQWMFVIALETVRGTGYPYYCKLVENQLWKVRNLFVAAGIAVPKRKVKVDPNKVVGKLIAVNMVDDEYNGKLQSNIGEIFPASELQENDEEEIESDETEEEEEFEDTSAPEEEEEEEEEPEPAPRKKAPTRAKIPAQRKAEPEVAEDELEELDLEDI